MPDELNDLGHKVDDLKWRVNQKGYDILLVRDNDLFARRSDGVV